MAEADVLRQLAETDRDAYLATLTAPADTRLHLANLHLFAAEMAAIPLRIREPMAGMVRLQWWRDALQSPDASGNPIADALKATIRERRLPLAPLLSLLEAREFDLYDDPMPSRRQLEGYLGETRSAVIQLACVILAPADAASVTEQAGHAGCAVGLADIVEGLKSGRGRALVPQDVLSALGATAEGFASDGDDQLTARVTSALGALGLEHLGKVGPIPQTFRPAFAPVSLARRRLALRPPSPLMRQWTMMRFTLGGRL